MLLLPVRLLPRLAVPVIASLLLVAPSVRAVPLLTAGYEAQIEAWLGQGDVAFSSLYTSQAGDDAADFHAAADGQGATIVLMKISGRGSAGTFDLPTQVIGGYNPQSWTSSAVSGVTAMTQTPNDADRTAFIFNLTDTVIQRQNLSTEGLGNLGLYQANNYALLGPSFGFSDLAVWDTLLQGSASNRSYGGTTFGNEIVSGGPNAGSVYYFNVEQLEVYRVPSPVPDSGSTALLMLSGCLLLVSWRRKYC